MVTICHVGSPVGSFLHSCHCWSRSYISGAAPHSRGVQLNLPLCLCGCPARPHSSSASFDLTRPEHWYFSNRAMVLCTAQPISAFHSGSSRLRDCPSSAEPQAHIKKVCPPICRPLGPRRLPRRWEKTRCRPQSANCEPWLAPTCLPAAAPHRNQCPVSKAQTIQNNNHEITAFDIRPRPNPTFPGRCQQHVGLRGQEAQQAGIPKDLYRMRYVAPCYLTPSLPPIVPCRHAPVACMFS